jgi:hypothetical protein
MSDKRPPAESCGRAVWLCVFLVPLAVGACGTLLGLGDEPTVNEPGDGSLPEEGLADAMGNDTTADAADGPAADITGGEGGDSSDSSDSGDGNEAGDTSDAEASTTLFPGCGHHRGYVAGDIDGDGYGDIALIGGMRPGGGGPWGSLPVAFSVGLNGFVPTNNAESDFGPWSTLPNVTALGGVFGTLDGRRTQLQVALVGGSTPGQGPWQSLPLATATGRTEITDTNNGIDGFGPTAAQPGVVPLSGDFDGDGLFDVALVGAQLSSPVLAISAGAGYFTPSSATAPDVARWMAQGARPFSGDFDGDGSWDVALLGAATDTVVVVYSMAAETPWVTMQASVPGLTAAMANGALVLPGDFNGDGRDDLAFVGAPATSGVTLALSRARGAFDLVASDLGSFGALASQAPQIVSLDADGNGCADLALIGGVSSDGGAWDEIPVALSNGDGTFTLKLPKLGMFQLFATQGAVAVSASAARR